MGNHYPHEERDLDRLERLGNTNPPILKKGKYKSTFGKKEPLAATQVGETTRWGTGLLENARSTAG